MMNRAKWDIWLNNDDCALLVNSFLAQFDILCPIESDMFQEQLDCIHHTMR